MATWFCPICQHADRHIPGIPDEDAKVKKCSHCPRCRRWRESVKSPIPPGLATYLSYLQSRYGRQLT